MPRSRNPCANQRDRLHPHTTPPRPHWSCGLPADSGPWSDTLIGLAVRSDYRSPAIAGSHRIGFDSYERRIDQPSYPGIQGYCNRVTTLALGQYHSIASRLVPVPSVPVLEQAPE
jgi:hypothetical protein